jgi:Tol biopolymer transport system component
LTRAIGGEHKIFAIRGIACLGIRFDGIASSPSWHPNGKSLVLTLSKQGNKDIYSYSLANKKLTRLTQHNGIDRWVKNTASHPMYHRSSYLILCFQYLTLQYGNRYQ